MCLGDTGYKIEGLNEPPHSFLNSNRLHDADTHTLAKASVSLRNGLSKGTNCMQLAPAKHGPHNCEVLRHEGLSESEAADGPTQSEHAATAPCKTRPACSMSTPRLPTVSERAQGAETPAAVVSFEPADVVVSVSRPAGKGTLRSVVSTPPVDPGLDGSASPCVIQVIDRTGVSCGDGSEAEERGDVVSEPVASHPQKRVRPGNWRGRGARATGRRRLRKRRWEMCDARATGSIADACAHRSSSIAEPEAAARAARHLCAGDTMGEVAPRTLMPGHACDVCPHETGAGTEPRKHLERWGAVMIQRAQRRSLRQTTKVETPPARRRASMD